MELYALNFYFWMFIKLITGFIFVMIYLNVSGRTQLSQMNAIDLVSNFILGGIIGGAIYSEDISYYGYVLSLLIGVVILLIVNFLCRRYNILRRVTIGSPIAIIRNGRFLMENILNKESKVDMLNIASQLNIQGICSFDDIYYAWIEPNGAVTAVCDEDKLPSTIICYKGELRDNELKAIKKSGKDVLKDMKKHGINDIRDIFLGEFKNGFFKYIIKDGTVYSEEMKHKRNYKKKTPPRDETENYKNLMFYT